MNIIYNNVRINHGDHVVLDNVSFQTQRGEMVYLVGQVGSGKTSLLKSIYGGLAIEHGHANVLGRDMNNIRTNALPALRRQLGIVHQDLRLLPDRTVYDNLDFVLRATDWKDRAQRQKRIQEVLDWVGLSDRANKYPHELSGGQQQCICIARACLNRPEIILADEPTGHLDAENGERVLALLDEIRRQENCTVIISTHNMQWPDFFPGTVYQCQNGKLCLMHNS